MKKILGTCVRDIDKYALDCFSISHLNAGILGYLISFWLFDFFLLALSAIFLAYLTVILSGLFWEFLENTWLVEAKRNHRPDSPINALTDILLVFLGSVIGCICYNTHWIFKLTLIGSLVLAYGIARIWTEKNPKNQNPSKKPKKND